MACCVYYDIDSIYLYEHKSAQSKFSSYFFVLLQCIYAISSLSVRRDLYIYCIVVNDGNNEMISECLRGEVYRVSPPSTTLFYWHTKLFTFHL